METKREQLSGFKKTLFEIEPQIEFHEEIKAKETVDRAGLRKGVTEDFNVFHGFADRGDLRDRERRTNNTIASRGDFSFVRSGGNIETDFQSGRRRNHRQGSAHFRRRTSSSSRKVLAQKARSACIKRQTENNFLSSVTEDGVKHNQTIFEIECKPRHRRRPYNLKCRCVSFWEAVYRARYVHGSFWLKFSQLLINVISMRAMREEFSCADSGRRFIDLMDTNEEPLAVAFVFSFDRFDALDFHNKGIIT